jgi:hypothetical protein
MLFSIKNNMKAKSETQSLFSETQDAYHVENLATSVPFSVAPNNLLRTGVKRSMPTF